jgi:hypothetical protein
MIKQPIEFENFEGELVTEVHYFHLKKDTIQRLEHEPEDGVPLTDKLTAITEGGMSAKDILPVIRLLVQESYGIREEGNSTKFTQNDDIWNDFKDSLAHDELLNQLTSDPSVIVEFLTGIMPADVMRTPTMVAAVANLKSDINAVPDISSLPDPNGLDKNGPWPSVMTVEPTGVDDSKAWPLDNGPQPSDSASGLTYPRSAEDGSLVPWAFREPTPAELQTMNRIQMAEVYKRKTSDWQPYQFKS